MIKPQAEPRRKTKGESEKRAARWLFHCFLLPLSFCLGQAGCTAQKAAPFFHDPHHGFRFLPPAGWSRRTPGNRAPAFGTWREELLVQYKRLQAGKPAWLTLSVAAIPPGNSLQHYLAMKEPARGQWRPQGQSEHFEVNGLPAVRAVYRGQRGKLDLVAEITAVRRPRRVYIFRAIFLAGDGAACEETRQAVASAVWQQEVAR